MFHLNKNIKEKFSIYQYQIKEPKEVKYDAVCRMELIETIPVALKKAGYVKKMPMEHKTIYHVMYNYFLIVNSNYNDKGLNSM